MIHFINLQEPRPQNMGDYDTEQAALEQLYQMRAIYEMNTMITEKCFDICVPKLDKSLDKSSRTCISHCAGRFLDTKVFVAKRLVEQASQTQSKLSLD
jgi:hypothetical protein